MSEDLNFLESLPEVMKSKWPLPHMMLPSEIRSLCSVFGAALQQAAMSLEGRKDTEKTNFVFLYLQMPNRYVASTKELGHTCHVVYGALANVIAEKYGVAVSSIKGSLHRLNTQILEFGASIILSDPSTGSTYHNSCTERYTATWAINRIFTEENPEDVLPLSPLSNAIPNFEVKDLKS